MQLSLNVSNLANYLSKQLNNFFPDNKIVSPNCLLSTTELAIERLDYCFLRVSYHKYRQNNESIFNHLYSDQYLMFLWFLSNTVWNETGNDLLASKIYYLNKTLHSFDCMYDTELPDIFFISHGIGTMLGKAKYSNYFIAMQGCTVGAKNGVYPVFGEGVAITANSSVIGNCLIGDRVTISANTSVFNKNIPSNSLVYNSSETGSLVIRDADFHFVDKVFEKKSYN
jgi:serine O-acetyltransferase